MSRHTSPLYEVAWDYIFVIFEVSLQYLILIKCIFSFRDLQLSRDGGGRHRALYPGLPHPPGGRGRELRFPRGESRSGPNPPQWLSLCSRSASSCSPSWCTASLCSPPAPWLGSRWVSWWCSASLYLCPQGNYSALSWHRPAPPDGRARGCGSTGVGTLETMDSVNSPSHSISLLR